jgi:alanyl-tRNA synthetase
LTIMISDNIVNEKNVDCGKVIKEAAKNIKGGGGGNKYFATCGGKDALGIDKAIEEIKENILK